MSANNEYIPILSFIRQHKDIFLKTNPYNHHLIGHLYDDKYNNSPIIKNYSCMYVPLYFLDLFGVKKIDEYTNIDLNNVQLRCGHIYHINVYSHEAILVYVDPEYMYYIDYYSETGRDQPFRIDSVSLQLMMDYILGSLSNNVDAYVNFHNGNERFRKYILERYPGAELMESIMEYKIKCIPQISDILRIMFVKRFANIDSEDYSAEDLAYTLKTPEMSVEVEHAKLVGYRLLLDAQTMLMVSLDDYNSKNGHNTDNKN